MNRLAPLALLLISLPASAQWQTIFLSSQLCVESSKLSTSLAQAERVAARGKRVPRDEPVDLAAQCETNDDCEGYCIKGRCVEAIDQHESARAVPAQPPPQPLETPTVARCSAEVSCAEGQSCLNGFCMSPPPPPSSLLRRGSELYVRLNAVQLRQDLALGDGPVIATLALARGLPSASLGERLRAQRAELSALMGDSSDVSWPRLVLARVDAVAREVRERGAQRRAVILPADSRRRVLGGDGRACAFIERLEPDGLNDASVRLEDLEAVSADSPLCSELRYVSSRR